MTSSVLPLNTKGGGDAVTMDVQDEVATRSAGFSAIGVKQGFFAFMAGPYYPAPPLTKAEANVKRTEAQRAQSTTYKQRITEIACSPIDTDGKYGATNDELVPLPFDCPPVDNDYRTLRLGSNYTSHWEPLIKTIIVVYPMLTLTAMVLQSGEYMFRKFMYYRLLTLRVLVDWENVVVFRTWFFYYFILTWIVLNTWSLYGVIQFWPEYGANTVSFTSWIVVNLQSLQLFTFYLKLLSTESRLVSLNQLFERAPIEAQS